MTNEAQDSVLLQLAEVVQLLLAPSHSLGSHLSLDFARSQQFVKFMRLKQSQVSRI